MDKHHHCINDQLETDTCDMVEPETGRHGVRVRHVTTNPWTVH